MTSDDRIDWSQLWYPGPRRVFSAAEMARAGGDKPSRTFTVVLAVNLAVFAQALLFNAPEGQGARLLGILVAIFVAAYQGGMLLWRRPTRRLLMQLSIAVLAVYVAFGLGLKWRMSPGPDRLWLFYAGATAFAASLIGFWFVAVFRAQQIEARLRELDERDRAVALARQLATAQVKPHFVFNTLASMQHWVDTGDARAAPLLRSLTGYLRATLPLFERTELSLADELEAVRRYLEVMQARWGARLAWSVQAEDDALLREAALPPGALLTLVENAVEHGAGARLSGGEVAVTARREGPGRLAVEILDNGPGCGTTGAEPAPGQLGLANTRARMAQAFGDAAHLTHTNPPQGGCLARLEWPCRPITPTHP